MLPNDIILNKFNVNKIIKEFPKSGQKKVLLVKHQIFGDVILKIVEGIDERIRREIDIVTKNDLRYVPKILEINTFQYEDEKGIYLYEEFIDGDTLRTILDNNKLSIFEAIELSESILKTLMQLEELSIVHRDIKPSNIIRSNDGEWYLIDFGIARVLKETSLTKTEALYGPHTPGYGAPELFQYKKNDIDSRADLFSLGVVLFEAVTGEHPFIKKDLVNVNDIWYNTVNIKPEVIQIDGDKDMQFMSLIETFMQKHISRRPRTVKIAFEWMESVKENLLQEV